MLGNGSGELWRIEPPKLGAVNPIGSGDSLAAGLLRSFTQGSSVPESASYAAACAVANALTPTSSVIHPEDVEEVRLSRLS